MSSPTQPEHQQYAQGYPAQAPHGYPPVSPPPLNAMAIVTLILAFFFSPAGIVTGIISLKQIKERHEQGRGIALTGLILSSVITAFYLLLVILFVAAFAQV
ncbi:MULTISPECIES: DUF4190 domain-containing protein [Actinosynnema]|uniref:DUF4190 domain-containing protein n=1 Tax=Actinosynnema TaxID=40566 RepID=UPI0020A6101B|nr:DUF4190 domain-containing protein [Actinosynnema pretiosum]MCP2096149.1 protein of unknown function (DUF4190) [Actinosynnema pretiosum]